MSFVDLFTKAAELLSDHNRWRAEREERRFGDFERKRKAAYEKLWQLTENIHIELRVDDLSEDDLERRVQQLNAFALEQGVFLDQSDCQLANTYVVALKNLALVIRATGDDDVSRAWEITLTDFPIDSLDDADELESASREVDELRARLIGRVRQVVGNTSALPD